MEFGQIWKTSAHLFSNLCRYQNVISTARKSWVSLQVPESFVFLVEFPDTLIRLGGFHITLNFLAVLGKRYQSSGIEDVLVESGAYGPGTVTSLIKGKSYNRGVRAHKLSMEALFRLIWQAFIRWLNADSQHPHKANLDQKGLVRSM